MTLIPVDAAAIYYRSVLYKQQVSTTDIPKTDTTIFVFVPF